MKRKLINLDITTWYHLETLKKYFKGYKVVESPQTDANGTVFKEIIFKRSYLGETAFIVHPKNGRLKYATAESLKEVGYKFIPDPIPVERIQAAPLGYAGLVGGIF